MKKAARTSSGYPARRGWIPALLILGLALAGCGEKRPAPEAGPGPAAVAASSGPETIECQGLVKPAHSSARYLAPSEKVARILVKQGARVRRGDVLAEFANAALLEQYVSLSARKQEIQEKNEAAAVLDLEIQKARRLIAQIDQEIAATQKLALTDPGFPAAAETARLNQKKADLEEDLAIQTTKRDFGRSRAADSTATLRDLDLRIADVRGQLNALAYTAPFDGLVAFLPESPENLMAGDLVIQIWDDSGKSIEAIVWQHQLRLLTPGLSASIYAGLDDRETGRGVVREIIPYPIIRRGGTAAAPQYRVFIDIEEGGASLMVDMAVSIRIRTTPERAPAR
ncbi:MAG: HlyD family efflux transporter periplasmic adaptor subunit [Acidobacteriota bacterium]|nr:HlyD family efflux transporter periplasmic adaptor subunit [Acidobacteriota bacterium]